LPSFALNARRPIVKAWASRVKVLEPLYPEGRKALVASVLLDALSALVLIAAAALLEASLYVRAALLGAACASFLGLPGAALAYFAVRERYAEVERELPLFAVHMLAVTSSGGSVDDAFLSAPRQVFKAMLLERSKYEALRRLGKAWDEILSTLEDMSLSKLYKRFLRGLVVVGSTSGRIPEYVHDFIKDLTRGLEDSWSRFWNTSAAAIEVVLLAGVSVLTLAFVGVVVSPAAFFKGSAVVVGVVFVALLALLSAMNSLRPVQQISYPRAALALPAAAAAVSVAASAVALKNCSAAHFNQVVAAVGAALALSGLPVIFSKRAAAKAEERALEELKKVRELVKTGLSYQDALARSSLLQTPLTRSALSGKKYSSELILHVASTLEQFGAGAPGLLDTIYYFLHDLVELEKRFARSSLALQLLSLVLPPALLAFSLKSALVMLAAGEALSALSPALADSVVRWLCASFAAFAAASNVAVSAAVDSQPLSTTRAGLSILAVGATALLVA